MRKIIRNIVFSVVGLMLLCVITLIVLQLWSTGELVRIVSADHVLSLIEEGEIDTILIGKEGPYETLHIEMMDGTRVTTTLEDDFDQWISASGLPNDALENIAIDVKRRIPVWIQGELRRDH